MVKGVRICRGAPQITHLMFADDSILFGEATREGALTLQHILKEYEMVLGQCIDFEKSIALFSSNTSNGTKEEIFVCYGLEYPLNRKDIWVFRML